MERHHFLVIKYSESLGFQYTYTWSQQKSELETKFYIISYGTSTLISTYFSFLLAQKFPPVIESAHVHCDE